MEETIDLLSAFIPKNVRFVPSKEEEDDLFGVCAINKKGKLTNYECFYPEETGSITSKNIPEISSDFIRTFYPEKFDEYTEDETHQLTLSYVPSFPKTMGHIQMIDAHTGKMYYVDVGDSEFF